MSEILTKQFEFKFTAEPTRGLIKGLASPFFAEPDSQGDVVAAGAFRKTLKGGNPVAMLWSHDTSRPVGKWTRLKETDEGLVVEGKLNLDTEAGRDAFAHVKAGDATGLSIGYIVPQGGYDLRDDGGRMLKELELMEISLVAIPSARSARITETKQFSSAKELKVALREIGVAKAAADQIVRGGWPALSGSKAASPLVEDIRALRKAAARIN